VGTLGHGHNAGSGLLGLVVILQMSGGGLEEVKSLLGVVVNMKFAICPKLNML